MLQTWLKAIEGAHHPNVTHLLVCVGENVPVVLPNLQVVTCEAPKDEAYPSIGNYHNVGAALANTEWIMKLDVDALPNVEYFATLLPILKTAKPRQWFNGGMFYINRQATASMLTFASMPLRMLTYRNILAGMQSYSASNYRRPAASNFICRRNDYVALGGCCQGFQGWGWEDYQQLYMLERFYQGKEPLSGDINSQNVTHRCRDEISRPRALELFNKDNRLALLHCFHPANTDTHYRSAQVVASNRDVLLQCILGQRHAVN